MQWYWKIKYFSNLSEKSLLTLYRTMNFCWDKKLYVEWCSRRERSGIAWLLAGVWQLKGVRRNTGKGGCFLRVGEVFSTTGPWRSGRLRLQIFSTLGTVKVVRSSPLRTGHLYPRSFLVLILRGWVDSRAHGSVSSFGKKSPPTPLGIDPETLRLAA
jgi:hypothetical protein